MMRRLTISFVLLVALSSASKAWVYPEHRSITLVGIQKLDATRKTILDQLWFEARKGNEGRLDSLAADYHQNVKPTHIDYAAWPAIAGDHSTSPENMIYNILKSNWILNVADITAKLKNGIENAKNKSEIEGELRNSDLRLLRADPEYASRAGANYVHFMLARTEPNQQWHDYLNMCFDKNSDINLISVYRWFHTLALTKANRLARETLSPDEHSKLALAALADEAFALHFLEDAFAAGHVAGTWGNASQRKGTHDYYDENGIEISTWDGKRFVISGDAYMRPFDEDNAGKTISASLAQVLDVYAGNIKINLNNEEKTSLFPDTFNIAKAIKTPTRALSESVNTLAYTILFQVPIPGLASGIGEMPRFRSELGPFIGIAPAASFSAISGGFGSTQNAAGNISSLEFAIHLGLGTDGVLNKSGDGLVFLDLGWRLDNSSSIKIQRDLLLAQFGSILSAIPSRETFYTRFRMPFYLIPGDLLLVGPFLYLFAPSSFNKMVATAGQGGLIPWQTGIITSIGRFQFMLGREIGVYFYGSVNGIDAFLIPEKVPSSNLWSLVKMPSTKLDFPILEYRPVRSFSRKQSANLFVQLNAGVDLPGRMNVLSPANGPPMDVKPIWHIGLRLGFDWRYYISNK